MVLKSRVHNLTKIKLFRVCLFITYPIAIIFLLPFAFLKKKKESNLFFFFDRYAMGGAQRVHLDILYSISDISKTVYFTRKSMDDFFKTEYFELANTRLYDIHFFCDNILIRLFSVHFFAFYLNRHKNAHLFISVGTFPYDMLPFINKQIKKTELLHNFTFGKKGLEFFGLANVKYFDNRIVCDYNTKNNIIAQYKSYNISPKYAERILLIEQGVTIPLYKTAKDFNDKFKILYSGRGGEQKRVWLIEKIATYFINNKFPVEFHFAGTMTNDLTDSFKKAAIMHGAIANPAVLNILYQNCDALILTSHYEGFPMVIKEAMANGCIPVVTALDGNKTHLSHLQNSVLIDAIEDEKKVVEEAISKIKMLIKDKELINFLSKNAYEYAAQNFNIANFREFFKNYFLKFL